MVNEPAEPFDVIESAHSDARRAADAPGPSIDVDRLLRAVHVRVQAAGYLSPEADRSRVLVGAIAGFERHFDDSMPDSGVSVDLLTETYTTHYRSLLKLAALLLDDLESCEDVVQEAFIRVHGARARLRNPEKLLAYLRQTVVNLSRSTLRRRLLDLRMSPKPMPDAASAEERAYELLEKDALITALRGLQRRQREVLVLRYFADLTEAEVASLLGLSVGSVKSLGVRGIDSLRIRMSRQA